MPGPQATYLRDWRAYKTEFENSGRNRKKPSEKFLGLFRKSSGMETAMTKMDEAIAKGAPAGVRTASKNVGDTVKNYAKTLRTGMTKDDEDYKRNLEVLIDKIQALVERSIEDADHFESSGQVTDKVSNTYGPDVIAVLGKITFHKDKSLQLWLKDSSGGQIMINGRKVADAGSAAAINQARTHFQEMSRELSEMASYIKSSAPRAAAVAKLKKFLDDYGDNVVNIACESIISQFMYWSEAQQEAYRKAIADGRFPDEKSAKTALKLWMLESPAWKAFKDCGKIRKNEEEVLQKLDPLIQELHHRYS